MWACGGSHVCHAWLCSPPLHEVHSHASCAFSPVLTVSYYDAWTSGAFLTLEGPPVPSVAATWRVRGAPECTFHVQTSQRRAPTPDTPLSGCHTQGHCPLALITPRPVTRQLWTAVRPKAPWNDS